MACYFRGLRITTIKRPVPDANNLPPESHLRDKYYLYADGRVINCLLPSGSADFTRERLDFDGFVRGTRGALTSYHIGYHRDDEGALSESRFSR